MCDVKFQQSSTKCSTASLTQHHLQASETRAAHGPCSEAKIFTPTSASFFNHTHHTDCDPAPCSMKPTSYR